jgi:hypothetical protein
MSHTPPRPALTSALLTISSHFHHSTIKIHKQDTIKIKYKDNNPADSKITKDVTPMHHDPMVINFGRLRRPNLIGECACR